jgi:transcriptional regulator with XRE-family HTH domain
VCYHRNNEKAKQRKVISYKMDTTPDFTGLFYDIVQNAIEQKGWSIRKTAQQAGVSASHLAKVLREDAPPPGAEFLDRLLPVLELPFAPIFYIAGEIEPFEGGNLISRLLSDWFPEYADKPSNGHAGEYFQDLSDRLLEKSLEHIFLHGDSELKTPEDIVSEQYDGTIDIACSLIPILSKSGYIYSIHGDIIFYFAGLIPDRFAEHDFTPNFANRIEIFNKSLKLTVEYFIKEQHDILQEQNISEFMDRFIEQVKSLERIQKEAHNLNKKPDISNTLTHDEFHISLEIIGDYGKLIAAVPVAAANECLSAILAIKEKYEKQNK